MGGKFPLTLKIMEPFLCCKQSISYFKGICTKMGLLVFLKIW